MLENISWSDYIIAISIALSFYYLFIGLRYFSSEIKDRLSGERKVKIRTNPPDSNEDYSTTVEDGDQEPGRFERKTGNEFNEIEVLIDRLRTVIKDASLRKLIPQEFNQYLSMVLKEYPSIKYSPLRSSINELIVSECQKYGAVTLNEDEVELLWKDTV